MMTCTLRLLLSACLSKAGPAMGGVCVFAGHAGYHCSGCTTRALQKSIENMPNHLSPCRGWRLPCSTLLRHVGLHRLCGWGLLVHQHCHGARESVCTGARRRERQKLRLVRRAWVDFTIGHRGIDVLVWNALTEPADALEDVCKCMQRACWSMCNAWMQTFCTWVTCSSQYRCGELKDMRPLVAQRQQPAPP